MDKQHKSATPADEGRERRLHSARIAMLILIVVESTIAIALSVTALFDIMAA